MALPMFSDHARQGYDLKRTYPADFHISKCCLKPEYSVTTLLLPSDLTIRADHLDRLGPPVERSDPR